MAGYCDDDFDWTKEELNNLKEAFKDKKFLQMFSEYAEEVTNPENVKAYESDVIAYERQNGNEAKFIHPEGGYVLKTSVGGERKAFINICANSNVEKPSFQNEVNDGVQGARWRLPHFLTPPRDDLDKSQKRCVVYDVIFHPITIELAKNERFRRIVNDIAIEGIESKFGVILDKNNIRLPKMKYKGTPVATITRKKLEIRDNPVGQNENGLDDSLEELLKPPSKSYCKSNNHKSEGCPAQNHHDKNENGSVWSIPKYTIKYRNHIDIQDYTNMPHQTINTRPEEIVVEINLPLLSSASHLNLDISEKNLVLVSEKKGATYRLDLSLAYPIDENEGKAQFDKSKRTLTVTLKVLPANNIDFSEENTKTFPNNDTKSFDLSTLQHSLDADEGNEKEYDDARSETADEIESTDILNCSKTIPEGVLNEPSGKTNDQPLAILPTVSNAQDELCSKLSEILKTIDDKLQIEENENMICEVTAETNVDNSNVGYSNCEHKIIDETANMYELHTCSKSIPPVSEAAYIPRFDFHQTSGMVVILVNVKNIDQSSVRICVCECRKNCWITFFTLGSGFVPFHYCLFLNFGSYLIAEGVNVSTDLNENNLVIHLIKDSSNCCTWTDFEAGVNDKSLQKYKFFCEENTMKDIQELKAESEAALNGDRLSNEHVCIEDVSGEQVIFDINVRKTHNLPERPLENVAENIEEEIAETTRYTPSIERNQIDTQVLPEEDFCNNDEFKTILPSLSKMRTSSGSSGEQSPTQRRPGILKYPRYWRTMSESSDDMFWSSMDNEVTPVGSLDSLGERPKKCVRFNDQVAKNVFRANSSILGQRKKNQRKARNRKKSSNNKSNSDGTTETSEEASDCNSASDSAPDINCADIWSLHYKSIDAGMNFSSENAYNDNTAYNNIGALDNEIISTHNVSSSMISQHPSSVLDFPPEGKHSHTVCDNGTSPAENAKENVIVLGTGKSGVRDTPFTIVQQPQQILTRQQPLNLQHSGHPKSNHSYPKSFKRTTANSPKVNDKSCRSDRTAFQRQDSSQGGTKQKGKRRRRWRKNRTKSAPVTSDGCNQEPSYSILRSPSNLSDMEQLQNENRKSAEHGEDGNSNGCDNMVTENFHNNNNSNKNANTSDILIDEIQDQSTNFWQCENDADDARYRTNCIVDFTNELMFQLD